MQRAYETEKLPGFMKNFEKMLTENGTGYFAGDSVSEIISFVFHIHEEEEISYCLIVQILTIVHIE